MAKVKPARKSTWIDMTPMVDLAFLLLTFFILISKFRPEEVVDVTTPSTSDRQKVPGNNLIQIAMDKEGRVFFGMQGSDNRKQMLDHMAELRGINVSEAEKEQFSNLENFGVPLKDLKKYLAMDMQEREAYNEQTDGIPVDSANNELEYWMRAARETNRRAPLAIKGDVKAKYPAFEAIVNTLKDLNDNTFKLVTSGLGGGEEAEAEADEG